MKFVLTGGPAAGKTSCVAYLKEFLLDSEAVFMPETATILLSGGFPAPGRDVEWSLEWQEAFQRAVLPVQLILEGVWKMEAEKKGARALVLDRGILDGAAFWLGGRDAFISAFNLDADAARKRYTAVIHLESLATAAPERYTALRDTNPHRFEDVARATKVEMATREAWEDHHAWYFVPVREREADKYREVADIIRYFLQ